MALINLRNALMAVKSTSVGIPFVACLNNTSCQCYTDYITYSSNFSISAWLNIANSQPSLSEGRTVCFVGEKSNAQPYGIEFGLAYRSSTYKALGAFVQGSATGLNYWDYTNYLASWHNVVITYTSGRCKTYVDGVLKNTSGGASGYPWRNVRFSVGCLRWQGDNIISGGPIGQYANIAFWGRILTASEIADISSDIKHIPTEAHHRYAMQIQDGKIADVGTEGGWDFTTIRDFENGVYVPEA